jgi:hypothetical protein
MTAILCQSRLYALARAWLAAPSEDQPLRDREPCQQAYRSGRFYDYLRGLHEDPSSFARVRRCLDRLADAGPPVLVSVFPTRWDLEEGPYPLGDVHERVVGEARRRGLSAVDLTPAFVRVRGEGATTFGDPLHPDETGHFVAALAILRALGESGAVPAEALRLATAREQPEVEGRLARLVLPGD